MNQLFDLTESYIGSIQLNCFFNIQSLQLCNCLLWPVTYRHQSHDFKTRLLGRGFYTIIKNVTLLSPTDVGSQKLYSSILLSASFSLAICKEHHTDERTFFFVFICLVFGLCFLFFFSFFLNRKPNKKRSLEGPISFHSLSHYLEFWGNFFYWIYKL